MPDPNPVDRFTWERSLRSDPAVTGTRLLVLLVLGSYMDADGSNARPPQATLAADTGLKERAVRGHLSWAVANGWLVVVQRGHHIINSGRAVASLYRASRPQPASKCRLNDQTSTGTPAPVESATTGTTMPVEEVAGAPQPANEAPTTGTLVPPTTDQNLPTSHARTTYKEEPAGRMAVTPNRILTEMARRKLCLARAEGAAWAPPEGCGRRREEGWLRDQFTALKDQHGFALDTLMARYRDRDPEWYVFRLDPALAKRNYTFPTREETQASIASYHAEVEAHRVPPERLAELHAQARATADRLRSQNPDNDRHLIAV